MWKVVYNLLTFFALPVFIVIGLANSKMRANFGRRLFPATGRKPAPGALMLHGASIGEAVIAQSVADRIASDGSDHDFLFTTNTSYAEEMLRKKQAGVKGRRTAALPFDLRPSVAAFLDYHRPLAIIIVETEIWPNLLWAAGKRSIPVIIVNGRISDSTLKSYQRLASFMRSALKDVSAVIAQSAEHRDRFILIGMEPARVFVTGNIKFYRPSTREVPARDAGQTITFGSVKERELEEVYKAIALIRKDLPDCRIYIAPRELHLSSTLVNDLSRDYRTVVYSRMKKEGTLPPDADTVIVDTVGDLMDIYARSTAAFVGGSLAPYGGQNMLEPLFVGTPVMFGPHTENFRDIARAILDRKAGFLVESGQDIHRIVMELLGNDGLYSATRQAGLDVVADQRHVMEETVKIVMDIIASKDRGTR